MTSDGSRKSDSVSELLSDRIEMLELDSPESESKELMD